MNIEIKDKKEKNITGIIQIILLITLFIFFLYARIDGYYNSVYIIHQECDTNIGFQQISKHEYKQELENFKVRQQQLELEGYTIEDINIKWEKSE